MEDNLDFSENGRQPQFFRKWNTTSIFQEMEDDPNFSGYGRQPQLQEMEDDRNFSGNGRRPQFFRKWNLSPPPQIFLLRGHFIRPRFVSVYCFFSEVSHRGYP